MRRKCNRFTSVAATASDVSMPRKERIPVTALRANPPLKLSVVESAAVSTVSTSTIHRAIAAKELRAARVGKGRLVVDREDLFAWIEGSSTGDE